MSHFFYTRSLLLQLLQVWLLYQHRHSTHTESIPDSFFCDGTHFTWVMTKLNQKLKTLKWSLVSWSLFDFDCRTIIFHKKLILSFQVKLPFNSPLPIFLLKSTTSWHLRTNKKYPAGTSEEKILFNFKIPTLISIIVLVIIHFISLIKLLLRNKKYYSCIKLESDEANWLPGHLTVFNMWTGSCVANFLKPNFGI